MLSQLMRSEGDVLVGIASGGGTPLRVPGVATSELVLVDIEDGRATFVRPLSPPHPADLARLEAELAAFARAGYDDILPDPAAALAVALERLAAPEGRPLIYDALVWNPRAFVLGRFLFQAAQRDELYPLTFWEDVPAIGLEELEAQLEAHLVRPRWSRRQLLAPAADRHAYVERWIAAANARLAEVLSPFRMCGPFALHDESPAAESDERMWLWAEPAKFEVLQREGLL